MIFARRESKPNAAAFMRAVRELPLFAGLRGAEAARLIAVAQTVAQTREFSAADGATIDPELIAVICAQAALPILRREPRLLLDGWVGVVVYPDDFAVACREADEAGIVTEYMDERGGEAHEKGPVVLSAREIAESALAADGRNIVIHEFAHKFDMARGGIADGFPPLAQGQKRAQWTAAFESAFADIRQKAAAGENTPIDDYAAEDPGEFFAVACEHFFETPRRLARAYPEVYRQLAALFRQNPAARLKT